MRRTGGTHVYDVAKRIFKFNEVQDYHLISQDGFRYGDQRLEPKKLIAKIKDFLYPMSNQSKGVVISTISSNSPTFGFIVVGNSQEEASNIYKDLSKSLRTNL